MIVINGTEAVYDRQRATLTEDSGQGRADVLINPNVTDTAYRALEAFAGWDPATAMGRAREQAMQGLRAIPEPAQAANQGVKRGREV